MSDKTKRILSDLGVTPWQLFVAVFVCGMWWATVRPVPEQLEKMSASVADLSTKVAIHNVLLTSVDKLTGEVSQMRRELSTIEGKLAHRADYRASP
jgi:hypothetical protein